MPPTHYSNLIIIMRLEGFVVKVNQGDLRFKVLVAPLVAAIITKYNNQTHPAARATIAHITTLYALTEYRFGAKLLTVRRPFKIVR